MVVAVLVMVAVAAAKVEEWPVVAGKAVVERVMVV